MKTARISVKLSGLSMTKVAEAIENYDFQLESVIFLREKGEEDAAEKLEGKIVMDLGQRIAELVRESKAKKSRPKK